MTVKGLDSLALVILRTKLAERNAVRLPLLWDPRSGEAGMVARPAAPVPQLQASSNNGTNNLIDCNSVKNAPQTIGIVL